MCLSCNMPATTSYLYLYHTQEKKKEETIVTLRFFDWRLFDYVGWGDVKEMGDYHLAQLLSRV